MTDTNSEIPKKLSFKTATSAYNLNGNTVFDVFSPDDVDRLEVYDFKVYNKVVPMCRFFYRVDPIASTVLNKLVEIGVTELLIEKGNISDNEFRIYEGIKPQLRKFAEDCALEYLLSGMVVPEIKYETVPKSKFESFGVKKKTTLTLPTNMWLRDPSLVKINYNFMLDQPTYIITIPDELLLFIQNGGQYPDGTIDKVLYNKVVSLYPQFVELIKQGNTTLVLENDLIVRRKNLSDSGYPIPYLYPALEALKHKRNLRRMDYSIASRVISGIQLIRLGSDEFPVTEDDEDAFTDIRNQLFYRNTGGKSMERIFQLFANHTLQIDWIFPPTEALLNESKYLAVNEDIFLSLGFPKILTTGETSRSQTSNPEMATLSPIKTMENIQNSILPIIKDIVNKTSKYNGFTEIPKVSFKKINLHAYDAFVQSLQFLYDTGNISRETLDNEFGYYYEDELEKREQEERTLESKNIPRFSPKPFSNEPTKGGENVNNTNKKIEKNKKAKEEEDEED